MTTLSNFDTPRNTRDTYPGWVKLGIAFGVSGALWLVVIAIVAAAAGRL